MEEPRSNVIQFPLHRRRTGSREAGWEGTARRLAERDEREATVVMAELRGWRTIMDAVGPPLTASALSHVLDRAVETLQGFDARDVALDGDPMQPVVSAAFEGARHALRATGAAVAMRDALAAAQSLAPPNRRFQVCVGINSGRILELTLGEGGEPVRSMGTLRSFASRLQEFAGPGQILLSATTHAFLGDAGSVRPLGEVRTSPYGVRQEAFALEAVAEAPSVGRPLR